MKDSLFFSSADSWVTATHLSITEPLKLRPLVSEDEQIISVFCRNLLSIAAISQFWECYSIEERCFDLYKYWKFRLQSEGDFRSRWHCIGGAPLSFDLIDAWINSELSSNETSKTVSYSENRPILNGLSKDPLISLSILHWIHSKNGRLPGQKQIWLKTDLFSIEYLNSLATQFIRSAKDIERHLSREDDERNFDLSSKVDWSFRLSNPSYHAIYDTRHYVVEDSLSIENVSLLVEAAGRSIDEDAFAIEKQIRLIEENWPNAA